ncbi:DUF2525 domain-containing protein [Pantoea allii]|uniref:Uncharacterized protein DUF2525 n=1 Tax=Pantoea allii TaxID=574096 RepID=A0A2V2BBG3_9GAMM|nr:MULTISPECIES: DUF2525 domain-containing protein [Pantoea]MBW1212707.1 YodD family protein [Pantoea allii]MBW1254501.1 YodD family protein [Pantoea allii]MBW1255655.1 YodD family protein [Pantoea allii]MBW1263522.1 YodD family protein [Pantoea allii]MBW1264732.1 YodD family protein [Pantoea allii]
MTLPHLPDQNDRDREMDALLKAIQPESTGDLQDYFSQQKHSSSLADDHRAGLCREPAEQCEMDIQDCRYGEISR